MSYSIQRAVSDGTMTLLPVSIEYFDREEISVLFDGVLNARQWAWVGSTDKTLSFTPAVANTVEVMIVRSTDLAELRHQFSLGAQFTAESLDESLLQILHIAQEAKEGSNLGEIFQNLNFHGFKAINMGNGSDPGDAVNHAQMAVHDATIVGYRDATEGYKNAAAASAAAALISESNAASTASAAVAAHRVDGNAHPMSAITGLSTALSGKQDTLVSGTNIKTVNGTSLLGAGDMPVGLLDGSVTVAKLDATVARLLPKAWGTAYCVPSAAKSYTRSGTTVTVTDVAHGRSTGMLIEVVSATDPGVNGVGKAITVTGVDSYTYQTTGTGANGTLVVRSVLLSGYNIASLTCAATGQVQVTFTNALASGNYSVQATAGPDSSAIRTLVAAVGLTAASAYSAPTAASFLIGTRYGTGNDTWDTQRLSFECKL